MHRHLQYHLDDGYESIAQIPSLKIEEQVKKYDYVILEDYFRYTKNKPQVFSEPIISAHTGAISMGGYIFNSDLLDTYKNFDSNYNSIKEETTKAIQNFVNSGATIRDLLYRMNSIDPIEREYLNRANKLIIDNDNVNNFTGNYMTATRDDTAIIGLMNHEIYAIVLYLLVASNSKIIIRYKINDVNNLLVSILKRFEKYEIAPNIRFLLLQSLCAHNIDNHRNYGRNSIMKYIKNNKQDNIGTITINNKEFSIAYLILKMYSSNTIMIDEVNSNLCNIPIAMQYLLDNMTLTASFRKLLHNITIIFYQLLLFNFMQRYKEIEIKNPIDRRLWRDREFQSKLLSIIENNDIVSDFSKYLMEVIDSD